MDTEGFNSENELLFSALKFLDKNNFNDYLRNEVQKFHKCADKHIFKIILYIPVLDMMEDEPMLCEKVLHDPTEALRIFTNVVYTSILALKLSCSISMTQILVIMRLDALPPFSEYQILTIQDLCTKFKEKRYFEVKGILSLLSSPNMYSVSARYFCEQENCAFHKGDKLIRVFTPGATEGETISYDFTCRNCGGKLKEDLKCRTLGEKVVAGFIIGTNLHTDQPSTTHQPLFVSLRCMIARDDDLMHDIQLGQKYVINGIPISFQDENNYFGIEACNLRRYEISEKSQFLELTNSFEKLFSECEPSPWRFALNLAYWFGAAIVPPGLCHRLKLGLLLNLIAAKTEMQLPWSSTSLLIICSDDLQVNRLLKYASQFAEQSVQHSVLSSIAGYVKSKENGYVVSAGSLLLASGGVCTIDDTALKNGSVQATLTRVLETGTITTDIPHHLSGEIGKQLEYPLSCSVWACGLTAKKRSDVFMYNEGKMDYGKLKRSLVNAFGMVYFIDSVDSTTEEYVFNANCFATLNLAMTYSNTANNSANRISEETQFLSTADWKKFIEYARQQKTVFSSDAGQLLQGYYLASRQTRSNSDGDCDLPLSAITTLTYLAETFAKLMLHSQVTIYDAVMAIFLYEESIVSRYGPSSLIMKVSPHLTKDNSSMFLDQGDDFLHSFHKSVLHFIMNYAGTPCFFPEE